MTTKQQLQGKFHEIKGRLRQKFGEITDDDFDRAGGSVEQLVGVIQSKTGQARQEIEDFVNQAVSEGRGMVDRAVETARDYAGQAAGAARDYAGQAQDAVRDGYERVSAGAREGIERAEGAVRRNPVESLAIALAAGIVVGAFLGVMMSGNRSR